MLLRMVRYCRMVLSSRPTPREVSWLLKTDLRGGRGLKVRDAVSANLVKLTETPA